MAVTKGVTNIALAAETLGNSLLGNRVKRTSGGRAVGIGAHAEPLGHSKTQASGRLNVSRTELERPAHSVPKGGGGMESGDA